MEKLSSFCRLFMSFFSWICCSVTDERLTSNVKFYDIKPTQLLMIVRFLLFIHGVSDGVADALLNALIRLKSAATNGQWLDLLGPQQGANLISGFPSKVDLSLPDLVRTGAP